VLNVSEDRKSSSVEELGVEAAVDDRYDRLCRVVALTNAVENGVLAHAAMQEVGLDQALRLLDLATVARKVGALGARRQQPEGTDVGPHIAFWRRHHGCVPSHHVVAGKQDVGSHQRKAQMVRCMPGRKDGLKRPTLSCQPIASLHGKVGHEILFHVLASRGAGALGATVFSLAAIAHRLRSRGCNQRRQAVDVIVVGVGDENVR